MNAYYSSHFISKYKKLAKRDKKLKDLIKKKIELLLSDKDNPILRMHKLQGDMGNDWSISVTSNIRAIFTYVGDNFYFIDLGSHDEVYR